MANRSKRPTPGTRAGKRRAGKAARRPAPRLDSATLASRGSGFAMRDTVAEEALVSGEHRDLLEGYFGEEAYEDLRRLSSRARTARVRGGPRVLLVPGIMGSKLGTPGTLSDDVIWLDLFDIARGELRSLRLPDGDPAIEAVGVLLFSYLKLKLKLRMAGFDADFHPFDWRRSIPDLGGELAARIRREAQGRTRSDEISGDIYLVAHSMGGLVSRAAMKQLQDTGNGEDVRRLVMLGTPNFGSFSPVQALAGYPNLVGKVATIDLAHTHQQLVNEVFNTFIGLYQMLPAPQKYSSINLYDPATWPATGFGPRPALLAAAPDVHAHLAPGADNMVLIAGINRETIVGVAREDDGFVFSKSVHGDGTVPLELALLEGSRTYYVEETHGSLPNNGDVANAVIELIETGETSVLPRTWTPSRRGVTRRVQGAELVTQQPFDGRTGVQISEREFRHLLEEFAAPLKPSGDPVPAPLGQDAFSLSGEPIVVGRKRQSRVDLVVANGDITQINTRALVLGVFKDVPPAGAARAIDDQLGGAITEFAERRLFRANVGDVFVLPANRSRLRTELVVFVGLGTYDDFSEALLRQVAENAARVLLRTRVDEFATVLLGAGSGLAVGDALANLVEGFLRGIREGDGGSLRAITFVEADRDRFGQLHREILRLSNSSLFDDVEATVYLEELPPVPVERPPGDARARDSATRQPVYLLIREMPAAGVSETNMSLDASFAIRASLLTAGAKATVVTDEIEVDGPALNAHLGGLETNAFTAGTLPGFGDTLARLTLPPLVRQALSAFRDHPLMLIHDARTSRIPWETVNIATPAGGWFPAAAAGLSRKYEAENLSVAKWLEERRLTRELSVLLIVNPTGDLPGAEFEGESIREILQADASIRLTELWRTDATLGAVRAALRSGQYDVVHYAGHAFFDRFNRPRSGLICHGHRVLTGMDVARLEHLPALVFFNACESARFRGRSVSERDTARVCSAKMRDRGRGTATRIETNIGLAESLLRAGVANYLGTYWPVGDAPAKEFGRIFYTEIARGAAIGEALQAGRTKVLALNSVDWADYVHYGSPGFRIKLSA